MHEKFEDLLLLYTTHSINTEQRHDLQSHLAQCSQCRQSLNEWRAIADAVRWRAQEKEYLQEQAHMTTRRIPVQRRERPLAMALALVAIVCIVVILFANRPSLSNVAPQIELQSTPEPIIYVDLVIAARPIENGAVIHEDDVMIYTVPLANARFFSMRALDEVVNTIARRNIVCGHQILQSDLADNARDVPDNQLVFREQAYSCPDGALEPLEEPIEYIDVVIAERLIEEGHVVQAEDIATIPYPAQLLSSDIILNLEDIVGHTTLTDIYPEQIIISDYVQPDMLPSNVLCQVYLREDSGQLHSSPHTDAAVLGTMTGDAPLNVIEIVLDDDNLLWYHIYVRSNLEGWLYQAVVDGSTCRHVINIVRTNVPLPVMNSTSPPQVITNIPFPTSLPIYTVTPGATFAANATLTSIPAVLCQVMSTETLNVRARPSRSAEHIAVAVADAGLVMDVIEAQLGEDNFTWYRVRLRLANGVGFEGWVRQDAVQQADGSRCPVLP